MPVRHAILGLLAQRPRYGYELYAAFMALVGGRENWDLKPAQVYTTLARLQEAGFVQDENLTDENTGDKRTYLLTYAGKQELNDWLSTGSLPEYQHDKFFLKLMLGLQREDIDTRAVIHSQRCALYQELRRVTEQRSTAKPKTELARILLLDKTVMYLEADLRWLEMIEARLDEMTRQPLPEPGQLLRGRPSKESFLTGR